MTTEGERPGHATPVALALVAVAVLMAAARLPGMPTADWMGRVVSLESISQDAGRHLGEIVIVPLGALLVTVVRLTLGVRLLGPFRPILIAVGFGAAGIPAGLAVFVIVTGVMVLLRPRLRGQGLPYFARLSLLLAAVVIVLITLLLIGRQVDLPLLERGIAFPLVVLTLAADGFARVMVESGLRTALGRGVATVAVALVILAVDGLPGVHAVTRAHPELLLVEVAGILLVAGHLDLRLFERSGPDDDDEAADEDDAEHAEDRSPEAPDSRAADRST